MTTAMTAEPSATGPRQSISMSIEPDLRWLAPVRMVIRRNLPALPDDQAALFHGALTEIIVNAINAHHQIASAEPIRIGVELGRNPSITVTDTGDGFDPSDLAEPSNDSPGTTSRGLAIARTVCPDLHIESSPAGTIVTMPYPQPQTPGS